MSSTISQLTCFSSVISNRRLQLHTRSYPRATNFRSGKALNVASSDGRGIEVSNLDNKTTPTYIEDESKSHNGNSIKSKEFVHEEETNKPTHEQVVSQPKKGAILHDFCLGIPFGGLVLSGGLVGFIFSRNLVTLGTGVLIGGALLALSTYSLKIWRQGKSSIPFVMGQAVLAMALLWKNFQTYQLTRKLFPAAFNVIISAAMLCFYLHVVISGGNPPPKKSKSPAVAEESPGLFVQG